jgi:hypothetical protein
MASGVARTVVAAIPADRPVVVVSPAEVTTEAAEAAVSAVGPAAASAVGLAGVFGVGLAVLEAGIMAGAVTTMEAAILPVQVSTLGLAATRIIIRLIPTAITDMIRIITDMATIRMGTMAATPRRLRSRIMAIRPKIKGKPGLRLGNSLNIRHPRPITKDPRLNPSPQTTEIRNSIT